MKRKLFCEISPLTYRISVEKNILQRKLRDMLVRERYARVRSAELLPALIYTHKSLIRRRLGNVDMRLQENKAVNLSLAAPLVTDKARRDILILEACGQGQQAQGLP